MCVTSCVCGCGSCSGAHPSLLPLTSRSPPSAFRGTRALSTPSRGALSADSWPAGVTTIPSVCGTPPAGRARPYWRWAVGRKGPPGRGVTQPPAACTASSVRDTAFVLWCVYAHIQVRVGVYVRVACGPGGSAPVGTASCCETCVFVWVRHAARAACRVYIPKWLCVCVTGCVCGCGSFGGAHPSLLPLPCRPPPSAFRGTPTLSDQSSGALTADSWPAGVTTIPSVCGTPPAGRARPYWRWAGGREGPPGRGVTQPPAARTVRIRTGHWVCAAVCVCTHVHVRVGVYVRVESGPGGCAGYCVML
jgi:hypothetical protein